MATGSSSSPQLTCERCGREWKNKGLLNNHLRHCEGNATEPAPTSKIVADRITPESLDAVCKAMQEGLTLDMACAACGHEPKPFYAALQRARLRSDDVADFDLEVARRTKQAEAVFVRDLMKRLNEPSEDRNEVAAAKALFDGMKGRLAKQNLALAYDCHVLLPIVRRNTTPEGYRQVLQELAELDAELVVQQLDERLLP